jgi:aldose 1-epimerase
LNSAAPDGGGPESFAELVGSGDGAQARVRIAPGVGNTVFELSDSRIGQGRNLLHFPGGLARLGQYARNRELGGIPFLYPWANRLAGDYFRFEGRRYELSAGEERGRSLWRDANGLPLHGLLLKSALWRTIECRAFPDGAVHRARLDFSTPELLAHFPFRHTLETQQRLSYDAATGGLRLRIETSVTNTDAERFPLAFGYHPYLSFAPHSRAEIRLTIPAEHALRTDRRLIPTGRLDPAAVVWPEADRTGYLATRELDHGFSGLVRGPNRTADFVLETPDHRCSVRFGSAYTVAVVYAPIGGSRTVRRSDDPAHAFVCFEPMLGPTNACNLSAAGQWPALPVVAPGATFTASFEIAVASRA